MASSLGFDGYNKNVGSMRNTGIDLTLGVDIFKDTPFYLELNTPWFYYQKQSFTAGG